MTDIEISQNTKLENIKKIAKTINIKSNDLILYGNKRAKINYEKIKGEDGNLILVTAINPTPFGEGKTTVSIGISDAINQLGKKSILALREPSLGPVFGIKGGATGGGYAQVAPMEEINLHFNGDFHAITTANNLLCALIDNHIFQGNSLRIDKDRILFNRCMDLNDRALRSVIVKSNSKKVSVEREDRFNITAASEIMAIMCLSKNQEELKERLSNIIVAYDIDGNFVYARDLKAQDAMTILLKEAIKPNLVQTLEHNPAIIHLGPFANIAHGCNSIIATNMALKLGDYVVTEAGFGADLGAEKFLDLKCRVMNKTPKVVVIVATARALKIHGGVLKDNIKELNIEAIKKGLENLGKHISNIQDVYNLNVVVAINKFSNDYSEELNEISKYCNTLNVSSYEVDVWGKGGEGALNIASKIIELCESNNTSKIEYCYQLEDSIKTKIFKIATKIYGAKDIKYSEEANTFIELLENNKEINLNEYYMVIAKTQYSLTDDPKIIGAPKDFTFNIQSIEIRGGAKMIVALAKEMLLMPGLGKEPAANNMKINGNKIEGLF